MVIAHIILCASSGLALSCYSSHSLTWQFGTFALIFGHSIIGIIDCITETTDQTRNIFNLSLSIVDVVPLPFINTELYLQSSMGAEIAYLHAISGIAPFVLGFLCDSYSTKNIKDIVILGNVISLAILAMKYDKPIFGILAAISAINRFVIGSGGETGQGLSLGLSAFSICATHIFKNSELSNYMKQIK